MKKIVILTERLRIADRIANDIYKVLEDKVEIVKFSFEDVALMDTIEGDLFLFMLGNRLEKVRDKIENHEKTLVIRRTIREDKFVKVLEIPKNTDVLVVNDNYENTLQLVSLLYDINVDNIILHPYREGEDYKNISVAITAGEIEKVPPYIKKIVDIGDRCLDLSTLIEIISRLQISDSGVSRKLLSYASEVVNGNSGIQKYYKDAVVRNIQMEQVLKMSDQGILMALPDGEITLCNQKLSSLIGSNISEGETTLSDIFDGETLKSLSKEHLDDVILHINRKDFLVQKTRVPYDAGNFHDLYFFKDVTYIHNLEQTISGQLKSRGFVAKYSLEDIVHNSDCMKKTIDSIKIFAKSTDKTVLIMGESGTGKELLAQSVHNMSSRKLQPFVAINCGAVPANLLESELFGYVKGAFTGASKEGKSGLFENANNGSIFLDEIGDMPYELQSRLLRVLQEKQVMRVGSDKVIDINVRVIAATNRDLLKEVEAGRFRRDLYYRLSALPITVPPLRERREDILMIFNSFLTENISLTPEQKKALVEYSWPGNVRELRNVAEYFQLMAEHPNRLPDYLDSKDKGAITHLEFDLKQATLEIILNHSLETEGIGRTRLKKLLEKNNNVKVSEYKLRGLLEVLSLEGLIVSTVGRGGTRITNLGEKWLKNNYLQNSN